MKFLSVKEALKNYKTSQTTLTRLARKHRQTESVKKENGKYLISEAFLDKHFLKIQITKITKMDSQTSQNEYPIVKMDNKTKKKKEPQNPSSKKENEVVELLKSENEYLKKQIDKKDSQLVEKDRQMDKLLQRQSEQNIIIQTLQNRFEEVQNKIESSTNLLSEKVTQKSVAGSEEKSDNGFTLAASIMIILLVILIVVFLSLK